MFDVVYNSGSRKEYQSLDGSQKIIIDKGINRIKARGTQAGEQLQGELKKCYKFKNRRAGLRMVFRQLEDRIEVIQIVATGKRDKSEVYKNAIRRLDKKSH
ncbi:type II toxin-antitoxin system RelE family toxin [Salinicoccus sp. HZC-1]|uniref:type II toxin-antitoxin system RelE family toxin n=1 Tax=Salinicoccus sp. HZC-1 TaxID=3385497 RepID=UPI00398B7112